MLKRFILATTAGLMASSCAFPGRVHEMAVDFNETAAAATDSVTLLNILRARDNRPMHFTSISAFRGAISAEASTSLSSTVGGEAVTTTRDAMAAITGQSVTNGANTFTPSAGGKISTTPSIDVAVHDSQAFYRGILSSVDISTIHHFLRQGWPADLITYLFVEEVRAFKKGEEEPFVRLENDPDDADKAKAFAAFTQCFVLDPHTESYDATPLFSLNQMEKVKLADVPVLDGKKFDYTPRDPNVPTSTKMVTRLGGSKHALKLAPPTGGNGCGEDDFEEQFKKEPEFLAMFSPKSLRTPASAFFNHDDRIPLGGGELEIEIRSVQGVLYYLGEYLRAKACYYGTSGPSGKSVAIFAARSSDWRSACLASEDHNSNAVVATSFNGDRYWIPQQGAGRSLQVLSLVEQLLNLQKSADDRPTTQTVRVTQ